jgi:endonuclease G
LELPAERTDGAYPNATEVKVMSSGERNYTHYYDTATYTSLWTAYPLEAKHMGSYSRPESWSFNPNLPTTVQVNLCNRSYTNSDTYVRGHLIPNASRNGIKAMQLQTFYVTNSVPQIHENFNSGIWQTLEAALQSEAESEIVYIVTGVAFNKVGESKTITYTTAKDDTKRVPIPNYFYKVALKVTTNSSGVVTSASTVGFWFENKAYSNTVYTNYTVTVDQVEAWTGFDFFSNLPDAVEVIAEKNSSWSTFSAF